MKQSDQRRSGMFAAALVAAVMLLSSAAMACTVYKGTMSVTGDSPGSGTVTAVGNNSGMGYCYGGPSGSATLEKPTSDIFVSVGPFVSPDEAVCPSSQLADSGTGTGGLRTYTVTWWDGTGTGDCMNPLSHQVGLIDIRNGSGSGEYKLDTRVINPSEGAICVSDLTAGQGNQVPVTFL